MKPWRRIVDGFEEGERESSGGGERVKVGPLERWRREKAIGRV